MKKIVLDDVAGVLFHVAHPSAALSAVGSNFIHGVRRWPGSESECLRLVDLNASGGRCRRLSWIVIRT